MKAATVLAIASIVLALLAVAPSAAKFTPAVFLSLIALLMGAVRLLLVKLALATITVFFLSPLTSPAVVLQQPSLQILIGVPFLLNFVGLMLSRRTRK